MRNLAMLMALFLLVGLVAMGGPAVQGDGYEESNTPTTVRVDANKLGVAWLLDNYWTDTGVTVEAGQVVSISAVGNWSHHPTQSYGPDGTVGTSSLCYPGFDPTEPLPANQTRGGQLIGRIVDPSNPPTPVAGCNPVHYTPLGLGTSVTFAAPASGVLQLTINDDTNEGTNVRFSDNSGFVDVTITLVNDEDVDNDDDDNGDEDDDGDGDD